LPGLGNINTSPRKFIGKFKGERYQNLKFTIESMKFDFIPEG